VSLCLYVCFISETRSYIPEGRTLHDHHCENLKTYDTCIIRSFYENQTKRRHFLKISTRWNRFPHNVRYAYTVVCHTKDRPVSTVIGVRARRPGFDSLQSRPIIQYEPRPGREDDHSYPSTAEVMNSKCFLLPLPHTVGTWCLIKHKGILPLFLLSIVFSKFSFSILWIIKEIHAKNYYYAVLLFLMWPTLQQICMRYALSQITLF
jgi:hypothetical protein